MSLVDYGNSKITQHRQCPQITSSFWRWSHEYFYFVVVVVGSQGLCSRTCWCCPRSLLKDLLMLSKVFVRGHADVAQDLCSRARWCCAKSLLEDMLMLSKVFAQGLADVVARSKVLAPGYMWIILSLIPTTSISPVPAAQFPCPSYLY